jgi:chromosome segregation ATPase
MIKGVKFMSDKKLDIIISKLEQHDKRFDHHENMIVSLIKSVATNTTHLEELQADMDIVKEDIQYIKGDVLQLKEDVHYIKGDVSQLKEDVHYIKGDVSQLKEDVHYIKGDVTQLKENQQIMLQMQQEQQKILESLLQQKSKI